ncbi:DNA-binding protein [mine drainage metagenome]|uniref:DNA-binding protein n=1 Tax=mine drainage metagenome TaxID=410659 RepID=T1C5S3_9ZZZZ
MMADQEDEYSKVSKRRLEAAYRKMQEEQQKKEILRKFLDDAGYERMMNVRISSPELYDQVVGLIVSLVQSRRITGKMTDAQLRSILERATYRPEPKIEFKHK